MRFADFSKNSFSGVDLTVLLVHPITVLDRLWKKRQYLATVRMDDHGLENLVMIADISFGWLFFQTLWTTDGIGRKIFRSIQCNKILSFEKLILGKLLAALQFGEKGWENTSKFLGSAILGEYF